jgi:hypothetical protein
MQPAPPTPVQVYERAAAVWRQQRLPPYIVFISHVVDQPVPVRVLVRTSDGAAYTETIPPASSHQKVVAVTGALITGPYGAPLGFCVSASHCSGVLQSDQFSPPQSAVSDKKVIASVYAYADTYDVTFGSTTSFEGHTVYDLRLRPRFDPRRYELRGMLVDAENYHSWRLTYSVPRAGEDPATIKYEFGPVGDIWYLRYVCDWISVPWSGSVCSPKSTLLDDYWFPTTAPTWLFGTAPLPSPASR